MMLASTHATLYEILQLLTALQLGTGCVPTQQHATLTSKPGSAAKHRAMSIIPTTCHARCVPVDNAVL